MIAVGVIALSSISSSIAASYAYSSSSNCEIEWNSCGNGVQTGKVTKEKFFGSNCYSVYGNLSLDTSGNVASRSCGSSTPPPPQINLPPPPPPPPPAGTNTQGGGQSSSGSTPGGTAGMGTSTTIVAPLSATGEFRIESAPDSSNGRTHRIYKSDLTRIDTWGLGGSNQNNINSLGAFRGYFPGITKVRVGSTDVDIIAIGTHNIHVRATETLPTTTNQILFI